MRRGRLVGRAVALGVRKLSLEPRRLPTRERGDLIRQVELIEYVRL